MWLVSLAQGVEASIGNLLHARAYLLGAEGVALAQQVLVFACAVDEDRLVVEVEAVVARRRTVGSSGGNGGCGGNTAERQTLAEDGPRDTADTEGRAHLIGGDDVGLGTVRARGNDALNHRGQTIEVGVADAPAVSVLYALCHAERLAVTGLYRDGLCMTEHLLAACKGELVDQLDGLLLLSVVPDFRLNEDTVASSVVPDVDTEGFDAYGIGLDQTDGTENAEGLTTFREAPLAAATSTNPRRCSFHGGVIYVDL